MRGLLKVSIGLVIVGGLLVGADRVAAGVAEDQVADKLVSDGRLSARPDVSIDGFPFVTQAISGRFDGVDVSARDVAVNDGQSRVSLHSFRAKLSGVTVGDSYRSATVRSGSGSALITYPDLAKLVDSGGRVDLSYGGAGRVQAGVAGVAIGTAQVRSKGNTVVVDGFQLTGIAGMLAGELPDLLHARTFPLNGLPTGLNLASVTPQQDGVRVDFQGDNIKLMG